jgi:hypothetical protein
MGLGKVHRSGCASLRGWLEGGSQLPDVATFTRPSTLPSRSYAGDLYSTANFWSQGKSPSFAEMAALSLERSSCSAARCVIRQPDFINAAVEWNQN